VNTATPSAYLASAEAPDLGSHGPLALLEGGERVLGLEEDHLVVGLPANLGTDRGLGHGGLADGLAALEQVARATRAADDEPALADVGKHGVACGLVEELREARVGLLHGGDGLARLLEGCFSAAGDGQCDEGSDERQLPDGGHLILLSVRECGVPLA
jgi:hypothetical protein